MEPKRVTLSTGQLHSYMSAAYRRGVEHEREGKVWEDREILHVQSEGWAWEFIRLRLENGLIEEAP